ncbi:hypothetical protein QBC40DRAFT_270994 [Triangularia verruculosa]|uniref:Ankyrin repeat protein n=1 Tax=Triangularia verruculosa TaxID=2587418 RepID=A0AAN7AXW9_9PEZI|nr:hypothetical protein QBC40DRAFT_270994 [Triangularia verruculosa]
MSPFQDARNGVLTYSKIRAYLQENPKLFEVQNPETGHTLLATAVVAGFPEEVRLLLDAGAPVDGVSSQDETPLLLANWKTKVERSLIVQHLLKQSPMVDATCDKAENKTALMFAIENRDLDSIDMLRRANASLSVKNDEGFTAKETADRVKNENPAVYRAVNQTERSGSEKLASMVISVMLFTVTWLNETFDGVMQMVSGLNPPVEPNYETGILGSDASNATDLTKEEFVKKVDTFVRDCGPLERFFKGKETYIQDIALKATELSNDQSTDLGSKDLLPKTVKVSLHKQVIYCDDSSSMHRENRWVYQKDLVLRIAKISTRILPEREGVALRFINQVIDDSSNLSLEQITKIMSETSWMPNGDTPIGTNLRSQILEPLVYAKLREGTFDRPLLISIMTDGMPSKEEPSELAEAIIECGKELQAAQFPRESVKFMIGQVGTAKGATNFLATLRDNPAIAPVAYITSERLDDRFASLRENERGLDRWLIDTLFAPFNDAVTS